MRIKFIRIGNVVSWTPAVVKRYPMISFLVIFAALVLISKFCFGEEGAPVWFNILHFIVTGWTYAAIDNQLPTKKYRDLVILLGAFVLLFGSLVFKDLVITKNPDLDAVDCSIMAAVTILPLGYMIYGIWKLRRMKIRIADRAQHIEQIRKRRKTR